MEKKNYTNSELFTLANQIRRETKCTKSEAYHQAKHKLEMRGTNKEKKSGRNAKICQVKITEKLRKHSLEKYNLKVGQVFASVKELASYMGVSVQNIYGYIRLGIFENVK